MQMLHQDPSVRPTFSPETRKDEAGPKGACPVHGMSLEQLILL